MTDRLYYSDPNSREFDATITSIDVPGPEGALLRVRLDRTCFYPTSGGQPFDTGLLGAFRVVDVFDEDNGEVVHVVDRSARQAGSSDEAPLHFEPGARVHGSIDWGRRFDHMQQHTGQHVLSAAFDRLFDNRTVGFHLGNDVATIDLAREMTPGQLAEAENEANRIVWEDRPVAIRFVSAEQASELPLRKEPVRSGTLRLIEVEDFDLSACGGTHVKRTGQIGLIAITGWERLRGGQRLEFHCGRRALMRIRTLRDIAAATTQLLSVPAGELEHAVGRLQAEAKDHRRAVQGLQGELARYRADELAAGAEQTAAGRLVLASLDADANGLKSLASAIVARGGLIAVLVSLGRPALVVVARSPDVKIAAQEVLARLIAKFGGRGGGKADLAQGGGLDAPSATLLTELREILG